MIRKLMLCSAVVLIAVAACAQDLTLDQVLAKNYQARGGLEKLKAVNTMRITAKMMVGPGIEAPMIIESKRPNRMRMEFTLQGLTAVQAFDGSNAWSIMPFGGKKDPEPMSAEDAKEFAEQADIDGELVDYKSKGHKVELLGKEAVEGANAYKLKLTTKNGSERIMYLDGDAFLEIKIVSKRMVRGTEREVETSIGDYKDVQGLMIPFSVDSGAKGSPQRQKITIEKVEINPPVEDARFKMPAVPKPEEKK